MESLELRVISGAEVRELLTYPDCVRAVAGIVPVHGPLSQTDEVIVASNETLRSGSSVSVVRRVP